MEIILLLIFSGFLLLRDVAHGFETECSSSFVSEGGTAIFHVENLTCSRYFDLFGPRVYEYIRVDCLTNQIDYSSMTCRTRNGAHVCTSNTYVLLELQPENNAGHRRYNVYITISSATSAKNGTYELEMGSWFSSTNYAKCWNLYVFYGPDWPLVLEPDRSHYILKSGEIMPDVTCATSCNPPCHVSWEQHSSDHVLHLGKVTETMTGEYTCRAKGHNPTVTKSIFLYVKDDTDFRYIVTIGSVQAITVLSLIVCGVWYCVRTKRVRCTDFVTSVCSYFTGNFSRRTETENGIETTDERDAHAIEIQEAHTYLALDARTRCTSPRVEVFSNAQTENVDNPVYENTYL